MAYGFGNSAICIYSSHIHTHRGKEAKRGVYWVLGKLTYPNNHPMNISKREAMRNAHMLITVNNV